MNNSKWLNDFYNAPNHAVVAGLVPVEGYDPTDRPVEEVALIEKAKQYGADAVFFEAPRHDKTPVAQAFIYRSEGPTRAPEFSELHKRLWSWGGVPLVYRVTPGLVQLFRCAHRPDFESGDGFNPFKSLELANKIASDPWWDAERLYKGVLWDDPEICPQFLSSQYAAQKTLINEVERLYKELDKEKVLSESLRRHLLILSVLIAYLEQRGVFEEGFFAYFLCDATQFFHILANASALIDLLDHLKERFNGNIFTLEDEERETLRNSNQLGRYAQLVEGCQEPNGQRTLWQRYSFADLPVELISHIYQLFVKDKAAVYTPHFVVRLLLDEVLNGERIERLNKKEEVILDPACGSGVFLVEAYKRLVLHWRAKNNWQRPDPQTLQHILTTRLRGIDLDKDAVKLTAFSLCLALCDALHPIEIRKSVKLFPPLIEQNIIQHGCFFKMRKEGRIHNRVGVIVGNPPFSSKLTTDGAKFAYTKYQEKYGKLPDKQVAYLFLYESMRTLTYGGVLSMLQQYNFLYNQKSVKFRHQFITQWDVREILDFISVRGLFRKGDADTKVIGIITEARIPPEKRQILHATFRRSGRTDAGQGFDLDYYDMHWLPRDLVLKYDSVWRCDLLGGGRVLDFVERLKRMRTLEQYVSKKRDWDYGEGYIEGSRGVSRPASHIVGKSLLPSTAIGETGIDASAITKALKKPIEGPRSEKRFTPPMVLVREHMNLFHDLWTNDYLTYKNKIVGFCASTADDIEELQAIDIWLKSESTPLKAFVAATSIRLFTQKATTISAADIYTLPYPSDRKLALSVHEQILVDDIVEYYRDFIRLGQNSGMMQATGISMLSAFNDIFTTRINGIYKTNKLRSLNAYTWSGVICQPYVFGSEEVDWQDVDELKGKLNTLLQEKRGSGLNITRIARLYDGAYIFLLKPDRLRYWLRSIALRDADEVLADLVEQGF